MSKEALLRLRDAIGMTTSTDGSRACSANEPNDSWWYEETNPILLLMKSTRKDRVEDDKEQKEESRIMTLSELSQKLGFDVNEIGAYDAESDSFK